MNKDQYPVS